MIVTLPLHKLDVVGGGIGGHIFADGIVVSVVCCDLVSTKLSLTLDENCERKHRKNTKNLCALLVLYYHTDQILLDQH